MESGIIMDNVRGVFAVLDGFVYSLISIIYDLIRDLASIQLFGSSDYSTFAQKIYGVMGLFMLFKVSFSLLTYIVDPDSFSDRSKGASTIAKNVIIVLVLIILAPFAFDLMTDAQNIILDENIIERFVFGSGSDSDNLDGKFQMNEICEDKFATAASDGDFVALTVFSAFYKPGSQDLDVTVATSDDGDDDFWLSITNALIRPSRESSSSITAKELYCTEESGVTVNNNYLIPALYKTSQKKAYLINYDWFWSTIAGGAVVFLFLNICIEIAKRTVKLSFLQLIAPIPIISYIDPKSGKDGMFKRWLKQVGATWASLFIRLLAIYFAVFVISLIGENFSDMSLWGEVFLIFGCLMFAKELPKVLENLIPGLNMGGKFTLNPLKNIRENMVGGKAVLGTASAGLGAVGGVVSNAVNAYQKRKFTRGLVDKSQYQDANGNWKSKADKSAYKNALRANGSLGYAGTVGSVLAGGLSAGFRSFWSTSKDGKIIPGAERGTTASSRARNLRRDSGYGLPDRVKDKATDIAGVRASSGTTSLLKNKINENNFKIENAKRDEAAATYAMQEMAMTDQGRKYREFMIAFEELSRKVNKNTHGVDVEYKFNTYNDYQTAASARGLTNTEMLTQEEFDNYQAAIRRRDIADSTAHQLQFENQNIEKQQNLYKGPGK